MRVRAAADRTVLRAYNSNRGGRALNRATCALLRELCGEARSNGLQIEQLLVILKTAWRELPEVHHGERRDAEWLLDKVVTRCIEEFFSGAS